LIRHTRLLLDSRRVRSQPRVHRPSVARD
jgi:hypothetical protein